MGKRQKNKKRAYFFLLIYILGLFLLFCFLFGDKIRIGNKTKETKIGFSSITGTLKISPNYIKDWYENSLLEDTDNLYIQIYSITYNRMKEILSFIAEKGTNIKLMIENNKYRSNDQDFLDLIKEFDYKNFEIKSDKNLGTNYMHSKVFIFDDKFIIQTANLGYTSFFKNREFFFQSKNKEILQSLKTIFQKDWQNKRIDSADIHKNLLVCNINCRDKLQDLLKNAEDSIWIETQNLEDYKIINLLKEKEDSLNEKIMLADLQDNKNIDKEFEEDTVKIYKEHYLHGKTILIDKEFLILGSMNLTQNSLDNNREISIVITNDDIINKYLENFQNDRDVSK